MRPGLPEPIHGPNFLAIPLQVPEPGKPLQAYVAVSRGSKGTGGPYVAGQIVRRRPGFIVGNEPSTAFWDCKHWPFHVYEITVEPRDVVVGQGELMVKTTAFRVVRELGLDELLGPSATDVAALFEDLRSAAWLAPAQPVEESAVRALVQEFYSRVAEHVLVRVAPVDIVRQWADARSVDQRATYDDAASNSLTSICQAVSEAEANPSPTDEALDFTSAALRRILIEQHFTHIWDAAWQAGSAWFLRESMKAVRPGDAKGAKRAWTKLRDQVTDRRDAARRAALQAALRMFRAVWKVEELSGHDNAPGGAPSAIVDEMVGRAGVSDVSIDAWNFALPATSAALNVLDRALAGSARSAFRPLFDLFRLGAWPIGIVERRFVVYLPAPA